MQEYYPSFHDRIISLHFYKLIFSDFTRFLYGSAQKTGLIRLTLPHFLYNPDLSKTGFPLIHGSP